MKKHVRIISILLLFSFILPLLFSCGGAGDGSVGRKKSTLEKLYRSDWTWSEETPVQSPAPPAISADARLCETGAPLFVFMEGEEYLVYNVDLDRTVLTLPTTHEIRLADSIFTVYVEGETEEDEGQTTAYNDKGEVLATEEGWTHLNRDANIAYFGDYLFWVDEDGAVRRTYTLPSPLFSFEGGVLFTDEYVIEGRRDCVIYYDASLKRIAVYEFSLFSNRDSFWVLDDGKLLVQSTFVTDPSSSSYDLLVSGVKYILRHELFDPKKESVKEIDLGVDIFDVYNRYSSADLNGVKYEELFAEEVSNILCYYPVEDGIRSSDRVRYTVLKNNGKVGECLDTLVEHQKGLLLPCGQGMYSAPVRDGYVYLDLAGEVVSECPVDLEARAYGYVYGDDLYKADLTLLESAEGKTWVDYSSFYAGYYCIEEEGDFRFYRIDASGTHEITAAEGMTLPYSYSVSVHEGYMVASYNIDFSIGFPSFSVPFYRYFSHTGELLCTRSVEDAGLLFYPGRSATLIISDSRIPTSSDSEGVLLRVVGRMESSGK